MLRERDGSMFSDIVSREITQASRKASLAAQGRLRTRRPLIPTGRLNELPSFEPFIASAEPPNQSWLRPEASYGYSDSDEGSFDRSNLKQVNRHMLREKFRPFSSTISTSAVRSRSLRTPPSSQSPSPSIPAVCNSTNKSEITLQRHGKFDSSLPAESSTVPHLFRDSPQRSLFLRHRQSEGEVEKENCISTATSASSSSSCSAGERLSSGNVQHLIHENVSLTREVDRLKGDLSTLGLSKDKLKQELSASMVEKHERRVRLLKEEFEFKLDEEKTRAKEELDRACDDIRNLEANLKSLEVSLQLANEKYRSEERHAAVLLEQNKSLETQGAAALKTVAQFSEKNMTLTKTLEETHQTIALKDEMIERLESTLRQMEQDIEAAKSIYLAQQKELASLSQRLEEKARENDECKAVIKACEDNAAQLSKQITSLQQTLTDVHVRQDIIEDEKQNLEKANKVLSEECSALMQRTSESFEIAGRCTNEALSLRQENQVLRQRLEEQQEALRYYKHLAIKYATEASNAPSASLHIYGASEGYSRKNRAEDTPKGHKEQGLMSTCHRSQLKEAPCGVSNNEHAKQSRPPVVPAASDVNGQVAETERKLHLMRRPQSSADKEDRLSSNASDVVDDKVSRRSRNYSVERRGSFDALALLPFRKRSDSFENSSEAGFAQNYVQQTIRGSCPTVAAQRKTASPLIHANLKEASGREAAHSLLSRDPSEPRESIQPTGSTRESLSSWQPTPSEPGDASNSLTRLVKVSSQPGSCRYELQQLDQKVSDSV